jgi:predicted PurR-regulated permease PerM
MNKTNISKIFLLILMAFVLWACYLVFRPFLIEIAAAAILVTVFYTPFEWLAKKLKNSRKIAALLMCLLVVLIVIVPIINLIIYGAQKSVETYGQVIEFAENNNVEDILRSKILPKSVLLQNNQESLRNLILDTSQKISTWFVSSATSIAKGTTSFIFSLLFIVFTMFFFFVDGQKMLEQLMRWTPLSNRYDKEIFKKFRDVSFSTIISTLVSSAAQAIMAGVGFLIIGIPAFLPVILIAFFSLIPYIGTVIIWLPIAIYLIVIGEMAKGIFLIIWGGVFISQIDNLIKAFIIKGKAEVHPIFIIFSILGGIAIFGFWGVVFGPLIISLAVTILHIYEMEFGEALEK